MNLLRVIASMDPATGGPAQGIRNSVPALKALGIETEVVCVDADNPAWLERDSFPIHTLGPGRFGFAYSERWAGWYAANLHRFDAVIVDGIWLYHGQSVLRAMSKIPLPDKRPRLFVMPHGMLDPYFQRTRERRMKAIRNWFYWLIVERHLIRHADAMLFTCEEELRLARHAFPLYRPRKEIDVGYGVIEPPPESIAQRESFLRLCPAARDQRILLFISRIHPKKGIDHLVDAWAALSPAPPFHLVLAGPGWTSDFGRALWFKIRDLGLEPSVTCLDILQGDQKWGAFRAADAFILPSHQENFGIAVVEALACNKPVFISNKVNIWREITSAGAGTIADDTTAGTIGLLRAWMASTPTEVRGRMSEVGGQRSEDGYQRSEVGGQRAEGNEQNKELRTKNQEQRTNNEEQRTKNQLRTTINEEPEPPPPGSPRHCFESHFTAEVANRRLAEAIWNSKF